MESEVEWYEDEELLEHLDNLVTDTDNQLRIIMPLLRPYATSSNEWVMAFAAAAWIRHFTDSRHQGFNIQESTQQALSMVLSRPSVRRVIEAASKLTIDQVGNRGEPLE